MVDLLLGLGSSHKTNSYWERPEEVRYISHWGAEKEMSIFFKNLTDKILLKYKRKQINVNARTYFSKFGWMLWRATSVISRWFSRYLLRSEEMLEKVVHCWAYLFRYCRKGGFRQVSSRERQEDGGWLENGKGKDAKVPIGSGHRIGREIWCHPWGQGTAIFRPAEQFPGPSSLLFYSRRLIKFWLHQG